MPLLAAGGAILLWSTLAALGLSLAHLPPFLLTGCALVIGALPGAWHWRAWRVPLRTLLLGDRRAVRLSFPVVSRAAPGAAGGSQSRQLSVAAAHRRADAGAPARLAPDTAPCDRGARGAGRRGHCDRRCACGDHASCGAGLCARRGIGDGVGVLLAARAARAAVLVVGDRRLRARVRSARARSAMPCSNRRRRSEPATPASSRRWDSARWARRSICGTSR